jgi:hypothetical protein
MSKTSAVIQLIIILLIVAYSTCLLFQGRFEQALFFLPLLMVYYVFVTARRKRSRPPQDKEDPNQK